MGSSSRVDWSGWPNSWVKPSDCEPRQVGCPRPSRQWDRREVHEPREKTPLDAPGGVRALWFSHKRRPGRVILFHRTVHPVIVRQWSTPMETFSGAIWQSQRTTDRFKTVP